MGCLFWQVGFSLVAVCGLSCSKTCGVLVPNQGSNPSLLHWNGPRGPWTVAFQAPLSMGFPRQEDWSGCPALLQVIFPTQGFNRHLMSPALAGRFFTTRATGEAPFMGVETLGIVLLQVIQVISLQSPAPKSGVKRSKAALSVSYPIRVCVLRYLTQLRTYDLPL